MAEALEFSVVVPVYNEAGNVDKLVAEIAWALDGRAYEMVFVDDASTDETRAVLAELQARYDRLRVVGHRRNAGQSRAIRTGVQHARGPVVGTLDGDGQNDPADLPALYRALTRADAPPDLAMVMGRRTKRQDNAWKRFGSRFANSIRKRMLRDDCDDSGCGIKVLRRDVFLALPYFDHMHRYMPALMRAEGFGVEYQPVNHRPRGTGRSKYTNFGRLAAAFSDLRGVMWLIRRRRNPGGADEVRAQLTAQTAQSVSPKPAQSARNEAVGADDGNGHATR
jgi:glycosyltransferase involved in cell wall biosynthesis